jgi:hypothetical protein
MAAILMQTGRTRSCCVMASIKTSSFRSRYTVEDRFGDCNHRIRSSTGVPIVKVSVGRYGVSNLGR